MTRRILSIALTAAAIAVLALPALAGRTLSTAKGQKVYVPVYSHVYHGTKNRPYNLSALLSIRNVDIRHAITVKYVHYYNDEGTVVETFFEKGVLIPPMATKEVHIPERDMKGGSGANFTVRWEASTDVAVPIIQAVMIGTASTQGISFVCDGVVIEAED